MWYSSKDLQLPLPHISQPHSNFGLSRQSKSSNMWKADADGCLSVCRSKTDCDWYICWLRSFKPLVKLLFLAKLTPRYVKFSTDCKCSFLYTITGWSWRRFLVTNMYLLFSVLTISCLDSQKSSNASRPFCRPSLESYIFNSYKCRKGDISSWKLYVMKYTLVCKRLFDFFLWFNYSKQSGINTNWIRKKIMFCYLHARIDYLINILCTICSRVN